MTIRPATPADLPAISRIQLASPDAAQWDTASYLAYRCMLAEDREGVIGFLVFRENGPGEREILNLAVSPPARRRGVARELLCSVLAPGAGKWFLEVRASNLGAIQLYETVGFQQAGMRQGYYRNPPEPAIVMRFDS